MFHLTRKSIIKASKGTKNNDWLTQAQNRQNRSYEYTDPYKSIEKQWTPTGWYYDEENKKWVSPDFRDGRKNTNLPTYDAPQDWHYNESTRIWVDAEQLERGRHQLTYQEKWKWWTDFAEQEAEEIRIQSALREQRKPAELTQKKDLSQKIRPDRTQLPYEEWKVARCKEAQHNKTTEHTHTYEARPILTQNEMRNFRALDEAAKRNGYPVNMKLRLANIATPRNKDKQYMANFRRISQKHIDFAILDKDLNVIAVIELDDSSHDTEKAKERDAFKESVLKDCGYKVIHTRYIQPDILDNV